MPQSNVAIVRSIYDAFAGGDLATVVGAMKPGIVWNEAENFPYADGNPYVGPDAVTGVLGRLAREWEGFAAVPDELLDAGDRIVALGHYHGTCRATGRTMVAQMVHVWTLEDGKAARFQQYVDTLQVAQAMGLTASA